MRMGFGFYIGPSGDLLLSYPSLPVGLDTSYQQLTQAEEIDFSSLCRLSLPQLQILTKEGLKL